MGAVCSVGGEKQGQRDLPLPSHANILHLKTIQTYLTEGLQLRGFSSFKGNVWDFLVFTLSIFRITEVFPIFLEHKIRQVSGSRDHVPGAA